MVAAAVEVGAPFSIEHRIVRSDGAERWLEGLGRPVVIDGSVVAYVGVTGDVTDRRRQDGEREALLVRESAARADAEAASERLAFLAEATVALNSTLDIGERLSALAAAGVPRIADAAAVHLRDGDDIRLQALISDPEQQRRVAAFLERWPIRLDTPTGIGGAIREGMTTHIPLVSDATLAEVARDDAHLADLRALELHSYLALPIRGRGEPVGAVSFFTFGARELDDADAALAVDLVDRAGVLIENLVLLEARERDRADQRYQGALLGALYQSSIDGILVVDPDGQIASRNGRFAEVWGFSPEEAQTLDDNALLHAAMGKVVDPDAFITRVRDAYAEPRVATHDEVPLADGRVLDRYGAPLHDGHGAYFGWAWTFRDVTAERRQQAEIAEAGERFAAVARTLQESLLPPHLPDPDGIELAARYHPAYDGIDVGGDFYDVFAVDDGWCIVLGDVCGKGPEAARVTGLVRWSLRAAAIRSDDPAAILTELNTIMRSDEADREHDARFATVCCMRLMVLPGGGLTLRIASAGHPAPLILRADGTLWELPLIGTPVGLFDEVDLTTVTVGLSLGEGVILVTDGVLEARDKEGRQLEVAGVADLVRSTESRSAAALSQAIETGALAQQGGVARDDIAILVALVAPLTPAD